MPSTPPAVAPIYPAAPPVVTAPISPPPGFAGPAIAAPMMTPAIAAPVTTECGSCKSCRPTRGFSVGRLFGNWGGGKGCASSACGGHHLIARPGGACSPGCPTCATAPANVGHGGQGGDYLARIKAWFHYHDHGDCPKGCACSPCGFPLYLYFLRDCAYRTNCGCGTGSGLGEGAVNPPYSRSIFPTGHMIGALPTGIAGSCCGGPPGLSGGCCGGPR